MLLVIPSGGSCRRADSLLATAYCAPDAPLLGRLRREWAAAQPHGLRHPVGEYRLRTWRMRSACCLGRLQVNRSFATAATCSRLRLPGATRLVLLTSLARSESMSNAPQLRLCHQQLWSATHCGAISCRFVGGESRGEIPPSS